MRFNENYERMIGSEVKLKILRHVLSPGFEASGRELARMTGLSHMSVNRNMKYFYNINLVKFRRYGRTFSWSANEESYLYGKLKPVINDITAIEPMNDLKKFLLKKLKAPGVVSAGIFGSVSKAKEKADSDIDLFVVVKDEAAKKVLDKSLGDAGLECMRIFGNHLAPYILTVKEYRSKKNKLAVVAEAEKGITII
jgi:predicted nucleotidyltransferase